VANYDLVAVSWIRKLVPFLSFKLLQATGKARRSFEPAPDAIGDGLPVLA